MAWSGRSGVVADGVFYAHTPHFLDRREEDHPEATDERIRLVLEAPDQTESLQGDRYVCWRRIREAEEVVWWMKVVVVLNQSGPAILTAYEDDEVGVARWGR